MELGLALPTYGSAASPEAIVQVAEGAERIGLAAVWTFERLLRPTEPVPLGGGGPPMLLPDAYANVYDPLETLSYLAAKTSRIQLATSVIDALFHPPVVLARRLATLDRFSGGRLIVGLGQGWMPQEFSVAGVPPTRRGAGFQEHIEAMRAVWGPDPVRYEGRFYQIAESEIGPKPVQPGGPPILAGAVAPPSIERAARMGLGLNPVLMSWDGLRDTVETFRRAAKSAGHDPSSLPVMVRVNGSITTKPLDERAPLTGSVEQVAEDLAQARSVGADHVFWSMDTEPAEQLAVMEQLLAQAPQ
ncbi:MAG: TIGR03619 family F420-dependent LLM class oxidoreductase [Egibacteraceae bacterium]